MAAARFMVAAPSSGSGKTMITCGILQALMDRGMKTVAFKCGPDYIDPMFHRQVIGTPSRNLDPFFADPETLRYLYVRAAAGAEAIVTEGVMGYYDGLGGIRDTASAYDTARILDMPVLLVVDAKGMSLSAAALVKGFTSFRTDSHIAGVILNRTSEMFYPALKEKIEQETGIRVYGYVPVCPELTFQSRHLGLVLPQEVEDLRTKLQAFASLLEKTLELDAILRLGTDREPPKGNAPCLPVMDWQRKEAGAEEKSDAETQGPVIAVSQDEAFCFLYEDNLQLLQDLGARIRFFSPLHDAVLPEADGLLLCGGYPELHAGALSENRTMLQAIREAVQSGMPTLAECGGFMYLQEAMQNPDGEAYPMAGAIPGKSWHTKKLSRFGYVTLTPVQEDVLGAKAGPLRGHEFHYYDSTCCGDAYVAKKPAGKRSWNCMQGDRTWLAGYPHLYYYSNPAFAAQFLMACMDWKRRKNSSKNDSKPAASEQVGSSREGKTETAAETE